MFEILIAIALLGGLGLVFGLVLAAASKVFYVETDPRLDQLNECLPGANCGGCGYAGCSAYAEAVLNGEAPIGACASGGNDCAAAMSAIMGVKAETVAFILVIATLVQVVEMGLKKFVPTLYKALGVFLPLITTNCAVLGVVLVNVQEVYNFLLSTVNGAAGCLGFTLAIVLFASVRERVDKAEPPECFKGFPIALISAGLLALAFMGFSGLSIF